MKFIYILIQPFPPRTQSTDDNKKTIVEIVTMDWRSFQERQILIMKWLNTTTIKWNNPLLQGQHVIRLPLLKSVSGIFFIKALEH